MSPLKSSRAFVTLQLCGYIALGMGAAMLLASGAAWIQTSRLDTVKKEYASFVAQVKVLGEEAERKAKQKEAQDKLRKEKSDAETKTAIAGFRATIKRLRDADTSSRFVSPAPAGSPSPQIACYGRERLNQEISGFTREATDILAELGAAAVELNGAKEWAQSISP